MTNEKEELLPCPFCGSKPEAYYFKDKMGSVATIKCVNNDCITRDSVIVEKISMKLAINAWNTRATPTLVPARKEISTNCIMDILNEYSIEPREQKLKIAKAIKQYIDGKE